MFASMHTAACLTQDDNESGLAPSLPVAILGRTISGIGGAGMGSLVSICITGKLHVHVVRSLES